ncbi:LytR/AlgR family response regulator transcription factor [Marinigracilibium pacificum]|uniref:Response regulator transcription factor n=1 Tax=Marinigracilibium pacificum TaxID=2729599 RepID=A0A848J329_9BACT|nr:LytTR family DNA-binding domain-containing protein [Marinigracilibium pacificum]NMM50131.1 response regulator transcription factor [Marinigracilibium pacificum]
MKCLIVDDEPLAVKIIERFIEHVDDLEIVKTSDNALEAYNILQHEKIDVLFLDINIPELSGLDLLRTLKSKPLVVLTTAYKEYAVEGFELEVLDYLVKPISMSRFMDSVERIRKAYSSRSGEQDKEDVAEFTFFKVNKKQVKVFFDEIMWIESLKDYIRIVTPDKSLITHHNLNTVSEILPSHDFYRVHKSFIANMSKVDEMEGNMLLIGRQHIPVGRNFIKEVKERLLG